MTHPASRQWLDSIHDCGVCSKADVAGGPWFVCTRNRGAARQGAGVVPTPWGTEHAKKVGLPWTACGLPALGWQTFHEQPFGGRPGDTCVDCELAVAEEGAASRSTRPRSARPGRSAPSVRTAKQNASATAR